VLTPGTYSLP